MSCGGTLPAIAVLIVRYASGRVTDPPQVRLGLVEVLDDVQPVALALPTRQAELRLGQPDTPHAPGPRGRLDLDIALRSAIPIADEDVIALVVLRHLLDPRSGPVQLGFEVLDDQVHPGFAGGITKLPGGDAAGKSALDARGASLDNARQTGPGTETPSLLPPHSPRQ